MKNKLNETELAMIRALNARGFAVAVFTPSELGDADLTDVEDDMIRAGWDIIARHKEEQGSIRPMM